MERVVYFVEDQDTLDSYIFLARQEDRFPGCTILAADSIDDAIKWCEQSDADVLFVVDSRMNSELLPKYLKKVLDDSQTKVGDLLGLVADESILSGTLGTAVLKSLKPHCRIILLTAFFKVIDELRRSHPVLNKLLNSSIDVALSKQDPSVLTPVIQEQLIELARARKRREEL